MNGFIQKLLDIDILIQDPATFTRIIAHVESLNEDDPNFIKLSEDTDILLKVLTAFGNTPLKEKE
jgi:hypothetical protein